MKTKIFLLLCLFLGIGLTSVNAQSPPDNKPGTGIDFLNEHYDEISGYFTLPVVCGGQEINQLVGSLTGFSRIFYRGGNITWQNSWYEWDLTGNGDEHFKGRDIWKWNVNNVTNYGHINLIGDKGTHYIASYSFNSETWETVFFDIKCPGSK